MKRLSGDEAGGGTTDVAFALSFFLLPFILVLFQIAMVIVERVDTQRAQGIVAGMIRDGAHRANPSSPAPRAWFMEDVLVEICRARLAPGKCLQRITSFRGDSFRDFDGLARGVPSATSLLAADRAFEPDAPYVRLEVVHSSDWLSFWRIGATFQSSFSEIVRWRIVNFIVVEP